MEYYVYVTKDCNLNCSYCCGTEVCHNQKQAQSRPADVKQLAAFIRNDVLRWRGVHNAVVFYGGEPLMRSEVVQELIDLTRYSGLKYLLQTNGTLLSQASPALLEDIDYLYLSIDGEHCTHDAFRGRGTFQRVVDNYMHVRPGFKGKTLARLTLDTSASALYSVLGVVNFFDGVYWQFVNSASTKGIDAFLARYDKELDLLLDFWLRHLQAGIVKNIIPFFSVAGTLLFKRKHRYVRCGCGKSIVTVDLDGECYVCDELLGREEAHIGNIRQGFSFDDCFIVTDSPRCQACGIRDVCGGRCFHCTLDAPDAKKDFYCAATKMLVSKVSGKLDALQRLLDEQILTASDFDDELSLFVEKIP